MQEDVHRLCANTTSFYIRNLSICRFRYPQGWAGESGQHVLEPANFLSFVSLLMLALFSQASCLCHMGTTASGFSLIIREARAFPNF